MATASTSSPASPTSPSSRRPLPPLVPAGSVPPNSLRREVVDLREDLAVARQEIDFKEGQLSSVEEELRAVREQVRELKTHRDHYMALYSQEKRKRKSSEGVQEQQRKRSREEIQALREEVKANTCSICMDRRVDTLFGPCNHLTSCSACAERINQDIVPRCPICRVPITDLYHCIR